MITKQDLRQPFLWSRCRDLLSVASIKALDEGWQGVFHSMVLRLLPIECVEEKFSRNTGASNQGALFRLWTSADDGILRLEWEQEKLENWL